MNTPSAFQSAHGNDIVRDALRELRSPARRLFTRHALTLGGLAMLTAAMERATPGDRQWIGGMQEEAFSLASEAERRNAVALAQDMLASEK